MAIVSVEVGLQADTNLPQQWDYQQSVNRVRQLMLNFRKVSEDMLHELWVAREMLRNQGARTDLQPNGGKSWIGYLKDIGLPETTARRWLSQYMPEERRKKTPEEIEDQRRRIREANARLRERVEEEQPEPEIFKMPDEVDDLLEEAGRVIDRQESVERRGLDMDGEAENMAQLGVMQTVERYIYAFPTVSRQLQATQNLIKRLREIAVGLQRKTIGGQE